MPKRRAGHKLALRGPVPSPTLSHLRRTAVPPMIILPLHRPLTRDNFPFATACLVLLNVVVFLFFQGRDGERMAAAHAQFVESGLAAQELPAFERHLEQQGRHEELDRLRALDASQRPAYLFQHTLSDVAFDERLARGELAPDGDAAQWRAAREEQQALRDEVFTLRHAMRSSEVDPWRMLTATFLHGGLDHLLGNMLFLCALGLLVECSLGAWRFGLLYLLGAYGSAAVSLAWRWGEAGAGLGASGAIAALMGAFCLIWGHRSVRFFYWVGPFFNYVRAPAISLFPAWLGWELYNLWANADAGVGFDAHAGGLVSGALIGAALVALGQVRREFLDSREASATGVDQRWEQAQAYLGRLQLAEADALLESLQRDQPGRLDVALARLRVAQNGSNRALREERVRDVLALPARDASDVQQQAQILAQAAEAPRGAARAALARRWMALGEADATERLLGAGEAEADEAAAQLWLELGLLRQQRREPDAARRALQTVATRYAQHPQARKAAFLLENG